MAWANWQGTMGGAGFGFGMPQGAAGPPHGPPGGGQGGTPMTMQDTVMSMMDAITQSTMHTNQRFVQFADHMVICNNRMLSK